ncbi:MAG: AAA family ATPase [Deltaproteobacteria bacterium]|nr:AAA family ATPase [Deltaproteobacteria bacterium]
MPAKNRALYPSSAWIGTGKTTLCRRLIRNFSNDEKVESHLILDPYFSTPTEFLSTVAGMFGENRAESGTSDWQFKENIKNYLFHRGVDEKKTVVLIIDEGQKLPDFCLEILREFLNYETNDQKLLQIVIFAQEEFQRGIEEHQNFADRINLYHILGPLNFRETRSMIRYRLGLASDGEERPSFFSFWALRVIYRAFCVNEAFPDLPKKWHPVRIAVLTGLLVVVLVLAVAPEHLTIPIPWEKERRALLSQIVKTQIRVRQPIVRIRQTSIQSPERGSADAAVSMETVKPPVISESEAIVTEEEVYTVSPETADSYEKIPAILGQIIVHKRDTLGNLMYKVYGIYDRKYLRLVTEFNREIRDPNLIEPGQLIRFPAVPLEVSPSSLKFWWVHVTTKDRLEDAYRFLRIHSSNVRRLGIIPCWNRRDGLKFMVLYRKYFPDEKSARRTLKKLPAVLVAGAKIRGDYLRHKFKSKMGRVLMVKCLRKIIR